MLEEKKKKISTLTGKYNFPRRRKKKERKRERKNLCIIKKNYPADW